MMRTSVALTTLLAALTAPEAASQQTLYSTDFTTMDGWTVTSTCGGGYTWAADATPATAGVGDPFVSGPHSLNFNNGIDIGGSGGHGGAYVSCGDVELVPLDLAQATGPVSARFWVKADMELGCDWDALYFRVLPAAGGAPFFDECIMTTHAISVHWREVTIPLDRSWGEVVLGFGFHALDGWHNAGGGPFIDDFQVVSECGADWSTHCLGAAQPGSGLGADLSVTGSLSIATNDLGFRGSNFPPNGIATLFGGQEPGILHGGNGVRCIAANGSYRLGIAPTRDLGAPLWNLDLMAAPLSGMAVVPGSIWYFQTIYRDGSSFNFSDAVRVSFCE